MKTSNWIALSLLLGVAPATTAEADRCTQPVPADHCLIGTWQAESTNAQEVHNQAGGPTRWTSQDMGGIEFVFAAEGSFSQTTHRDSSSQFESKIGDRSQKRTVRIQSNATGRWSPSGTDGFVLCKETFEMKMGEGAAATPLPPEVLAAETAGEIAYGFSCEGDTAEVTMLTPGLPGISWTARRVSP